MSLTFTSLNAERGSPIMTGLMERLDAIPLPAWIALVVVSFIVFWPIGLALLIYLKWSGRMFCSRYGRSGHWSGPDGRSERREAREEWRAWKRRARWGGGGSGNVAFDEYREETLRKLAEEQREVRAFPVRLAPPQGPSGCRPFKDGAAQPPPSPRAAARRIPRRLKPPFTPLP